MHTFCILRLCDSAKGEGEGRGWGHGERQTDAVRCHEDQTCVLGFIDNILWTDELISPGETIIVLLVTVTHMESSARRHHGNSLCSVCSLGTHSPEVVLFKLVHLRF